ncbi:MAG TPA: hypothetical protein VD862_04780 [Candidatus Paceibacterota bacterium]|nr:hypothetical protein [Candidatus Paceibacterota bacterium]
MACGCGGCRLLPGKLSPFYTQAQRSRAELSPVFLGLFTRERWDGHDRLYLFICRSCRQGRFSFPCYFTGNWAGVPHLHCEWCPDTVYLIGDKETYRELGLPDPPSGWERFFYELRMAFKKPPRCLPGGDSHS